jgi:hypothetical protein
LEEAEKMLNKLRRGFFIQSDQEAGVGGHE